MGCPSSPPLPPPCQCQGQNPVSLALCRALSSPCRRFWSESERKAGRGPPVRKIIASCPRKSALRPVYSSPPKVGVGGRVRGGGPGPEPGPSLPNDAGQPPPLSCRPWPGCHPPTKVLAKGRLGSCGHLPLPLSMLRGSRWSTCWGEGGRERCYLGKQCPPPTRAVAIACGWTVGVGGRRPHSGPRQ